MIIERLSWKMCSNIAETFRFYFFGIACVRYLHMYEDVSVHMCACILVRRPNERLYKDNGFIYSEWLHFPQYQVQSNPFHTVRSHYSCSCVCCCYHWCNVVHALTCRSMLHVSYFMCCTRCTRVYLNILNRSILSSIWHWVWDTLISLAYIVPINGKIMENPVNTHNHTQTRSFIRFLFLCSAFFLLGKKSLGKLHFSLDTCEICLWPIVNFCCQFLTHLNQSSFSSDFKCTSAIFYGFWFKKHRLLVA